MSLKQTHLKQTAEPLYISPGELILAECGEAIPDAMYDFGISGDISGDQLRSKLEELAMNSLRFCQKCLKVDLTKRYISGIRSRAEEREENVA